MTQVEEQTSEEILANIAYHPQCEVRRRVFDKWVQCVNYATWALVCLNCADNIFYCDDCRTMFIRIASDPTPRDIACRVCGNHAKVDALEWVNIGGGATRA